MTNKRFEGTKTRLGQSKGDCTKNEKVGLQINPDANGGKIPTWKCFHSKVCDRCLTVCDFEVYVGMLVHCSKRRTI